MMVTPERNNPLGLPSSVRVKRAADKILKALHMLYPSERTRALEVVRLLTDEGDVIGMADPKDEA